MSNTLSLAALSIALMTTSAFAGGHCAAGKTLTEGTLTIATGNPAYYPWVLDDAPESGQGFEAAVAYAMAEEMGFAADDVVWVRSSFDEAIQPGAKNFDPSKLLALHRYCGWLNYLGLPALALPVGVDGQGLPVSIQLVAKPFHEHHLLALGQKMQQDLLGENGIAPVCHIQE